MEHSIGVGILVGLAFATTIAFNQSKHFSKKQKIVLTILILFLPGQLITALGFYLYNSFHKEVSQKLNVKLNQNNFLYHIIENGEQSTPLTFDHLKDKRITNETLIWRKGFDNWTKAKDLKEIQQLIYKAPPPIPKIEIIEDKFLIDDKVYTLSAIKKAFQNGDYLFGRDDEIKLIKNNDFEDPALVTIQNFEPLYQFKSYFPPKI